MMQTADAVVSIDDARFYAFHGVMPQERRVGGWFSVSLRVHYNNIEKACQSDCVDDTLNYALLMNLLRREMQQPSMLLENVAWRIGQAVFAQWSQAQAVEVKVMKQNPPMGGSMAGAGVELHLINDKTQCGSSVLC